MDSTILSKANVATIIAVIFLILTFGGCKKEEQKPSANKTLISFEKVSTLSAQSIQTNLSLFKLLYPQTAEIPTNSTVDVDIYIIKYKTIFREIEIEVSGVGCIPRANSSLPILSFQNGTNASINEAPSLNTNSQEFALLQNSAGLGYIVLIPDYLGFGASKHILHPYYHRESNNAVIIDLVKACLEMLNDESIKCKSNGDLYLMGYSQGGWATLSAFKALEENNTLNMNLIGASCGAGAYNLMEVASHILKGNYYRSPSYLPYFIESHRRNGLLDISLDQFFNEPYRSRIPGLFDGLHTTGQINDQLNDSVAQFFTRNVIDNFETGTEYEPIRDELKINSVVAWKPNGQLLFVHGKKDMDVPVFESENMVQEILKLEADSAKIELHLLDNLSHAQAITPWSIQTLIWLTKLNALEKNRAH